jgi:hypothetical protein
MSKNKAWIQYTKQGEIVPGSLIVSPRRPINGVWYEVVTDICCDTEPPFGLISSRQKAFVKYDASGNIVPGSLVLTDGRLPRPGIWKEVYIDICCSTTTTTTTRPIISIIIEDPFGNSNGSIQSFGISPLYVGQTFTLPQAGNLESILLRLLKFNGSNALFNIELVIYEVVAGVPTDTILGISNSVSTNSIIDFIPNLFTFSNVILPAGQYLFITRYTDVVVHDSSNWIEYVSNSSGTYAGGEQGYTLTADSGATWDPSTIPGWDMLSQVNYSVY